MKYYSFDEPLTSPDDFFMKEALKEAHFALDADEVPVGAVLVGNGRIIGKGYNLTERLNDVTAMQKCKLLQRQQIFWEESI